DRIDTLAERVVAGRFGTLRIALCALLLGLVGTTVPNYRNLWDKEFEATASSWDAFLVKRDNLFVDLGKVYGVGSHNSNTNFRLTVPLIARILGLGRLGVLVFQSVCGVLLLWIVARIVTKIANDLVAALFVTCG